METPSDDVVVKPEPAGFVSFLAVAGLLDVAVIWVVSFKP